MFLPISHLCSFNN